MTDMLRVLVRVSLTVAVLFGVAIAAEARPYRLQWDANSDSATRGYMVYYGTAPGTYNLGNGIDVLNSTEFQVDLSPGQTYYFAVRAYDASAVLGPSSAELSFFVPTVRISTNLPSPQAAGTPVTVNATGLSGNFEYQFVLRDPAGIWSIVKPYGSSTSWAWNTSGNPSGEYMLQVWSRPVGTAVVYETWDGMPFRLMGTAQPPVTSVSLTTDTPSPQFTGAQVTVRASATGTTGNYEYQFVLRNPAGVWSVVRPYSTVPYWNWGTATAGEYFIQVWARNVGSIAPYEAFMGVEFHRVTSASSPVSAVSINSNRLSPQPTGTQITFSANASGGGGSYQYQFVVRNPSGVWTVERPYGSTGSWTWNTSGKPTGEYYVQVWARNAGSNSAYEAFNGMSYRLGGTATPPVTAVSISSNLSSPRTAGAQVTFTANATGTTGNYQYQFVLRNPAGAWTIVRTYGTSNTWTWNTSGLSAGEYYIQVWARNSGSSADYEAFNGRTFVIQ